MKNEPEDDVSFHLDAEWVTRAFTMRGKEVRKRFILSYQVVVRNDTIDKEHQHFRRSGRRLSLRQLLSEAYQLACKSGVTARTPRSIILGGHFLASSWLAFGRST